MDGGRALLVHTGQPGEQRIAGEVRHALEQRDELGDGHGGQAREPIEAAARRTPQAASGARADRRVPARRARSRHQ